MLCGGRLWGTFYVFIYFLLFFSRRLYSFNLVIVQMTWKIYYPRHLLKYLSSHFISWVLWHGIKGTVQMKREFQLNELFQTQSKGRPCRVSLQSRNISKLTVHYNFCSKLIAMGKKSGGNA